MLAIASSLLLLALLEVFWLQKLYTDEKNQLRQTINQTLSTNFAQLQITYMQRNNVRLIDSFLSEKQKEDDKKASYQIPLEVFFKNSQNTFYAKLDTLSALKLGNSADNATIDSFLNVMRQFYRVNTPSVSDIGKSQKDTSKWHIAFVANQAKCYQSLWHLYTLKFSPQLNRQRMDMFFESLKTFIQKEEMAAQQNIMYNVFNIGKDKINKKPLAFVNQSKSLDDVQIFLSGDSNVKKQPSKRDSFLSIYAYDFQKFVGSLIQTEDVKAILEQHFNGYNFKFDVKRLAASDMVTSDANALILSIPAGNKEGFKKEKIGVAVYGYQAYIFKKILPEIAFSIMVFVITGLAFWLIYRSMMRQERLIELKNDFISNMTHELKTPITTVGVAIEAMNNFNALKNPEQAKEYLDISQNELSRLSLLVDKVLKMASFEEKDSILNISKLDLLELTEQIVKSMKLQFEKFHATIDFKKEPNQAFDIQADKTHISSVIYNLIDNALKYGGDNPCINIDLKRINENEISLTVVDSGQGIPPQYMDKIFEKFFRIPMGNVHNIKGHGLGLSYVANVVKQHGGRIGVKSEEGKGSKFEVILPAV